MAGPWNLQGAAVDFSPLGRLYENFVSAQDHAIKKRQDEEAGPLIQNAYAAALQGQQPQAGSLSALAAQTQGQPGGAGGAVPRLPSFAQTGGKMASAAPIGGFDNAVNRTFQFEGGWNPNDAGKGPTARGLNGQSNPGVDLQRAMSDPAYAKQVYKQNYWDAIGGDQIAAQNPALAHVAFDAAVNSGPGKAKEWLQQSGGDPNKLLELRSNFLGGLIQSNPDKYKQYANAWGQRIASLRADINGAGQQTMTGPSAAPPTSMVAYNGMPQPMGAPPTQVAAAQPPVPRQGPFSPAFTPPQGGGMQLPPGAAMAGAPGGEQPAQLASAPDAPDTGVYQRFTITPPGGRPRPATDAEQASILAEIKQHEAEIAAETRRAGVDANRGPELGPSYQQPQRPMQVPAQAAAAMPTQNPNGGGAANPAPAQTSSPILAGRASGPAVSPDPRANAFGSGDPAQSGGQASFYMPGSPVLPPTAAPAPRAPAMALAAPQPPQGLTAGSPGGAGGMSPAQQAAYMAALRNPVSRPIAAQLLGAQLKPAEYGFTTTPDGTVLRQNPRTGQVEPVYQTTPKPDIDVKEVNGRLIAFDKRTQQSTDVTPAGMPDGARPMTPQDKIRYSISPETGAYFDAKGVPHTLGPQSVVNVETKTEATFDKTMAEGSAKRWNGYIENADKAQSAMGDISNLRELSGRLGVQGATAGIKEALGPYAQSLGINLEGLSDIQAYTSIIQRLAPQMHVAGSGSTSNIEFQGMLRALPGLSAHPEARNAIMDTMEAGARYAIEKGDIARDLADKTITRPEAEKRIRALGDPLTSFREWRKANPQVFGAALRDGVKGNQGGNSGPAASTGSPQPRQAPASPAEAAEALAGAKAALAAGAPRAAIEKRLRENGIDPAGL